VKELKSEPGRKWDWWISVEYVDNTIADVINALRHLGKVHLDDEDVSAQDIVNLEGVELDLDEEIQHAFTPGERIMDAHGVLAQMFYSASTMKGHPNGLDHSILIFPCVGVKCRDKETAVLLYLALQRVPAAEIAIRRYYEGWTPLNGPEFAIEDDGTVRGELDHPSD